jgi:hypothetical protein
VCNPANTACGTGSQQISCNEKSDCNGGVCCASTFMVPVAVQGNTSCSSGTTTCAGWQSCRVDSECGQNSDAGALKRCLPQICTNPQTKATLTIEACAVGYTDGGALIDCKPL